MSFITIYYLTLILIIGIIVFAYIIYRRIATPSITNQLFIAYVVSDMLKTSENATDKKESTTQLQNKIKEIDLKNNALKQLRQNIEKEREKIKEKIDDSTRDLKEEHDLLLAAIDNLSLGFIITDKEKNIILTNKTTKRLFPYDQIAPYIKENINSQKSSPLENIQINNKLVNISISTQPTGYTILIKDEDKDRLTEQSKKKFITVASDELRTPLTAIKGYLSLIKQLYYADIKDEKLKKMINDIDTSCRRLINIINDFLDTSKLEQGKINFHQEECDLIYIINASIKETESIATEKKLFIKFDEPQESIKVLGDKEKIKQVAINLISNAIKYTDKGGVTLNLEKSSDKNYKVSVKDTGIGIPPENAKSLFSKFQQNDPNKPVNVISTGLGLYISKLLIEKMNGNIELDYSEKDKGSTFSFSLPMYEKKSI